MNLSNINWKQLSKTFAAPLVILLALALMPFYGWEYGVSLFSHFLIYIILTVSWVMFSGATGYISLATAAFYGIGIYSAALLHPATGFSLPLIAVIIVSAAASFLVAFIVGAITLRLKGIYFAMFTFGLVLLLFQVINYVETSILGQRGRFVALESNETIYYYLLGIFVVTMIVTFFIKNTKYGLALRSIGENEDAAAHSGVNVTMVKVLIFAVSAALMSTVGVVMATKTIYVDASTAFNPMMSFSPALMAIFGGMANLYGPAVGAVIFSYVQEILQTGNLNNYYMLIFGSILIATILYMPQGLMGLIQNLWNRLKGAKRALTRG
ncbi:MAG: branched-chain amino acid ABC transporter permease [Dehalococcoidales bacterium]|nr:branched-chain amino acid ABC transporter permease [Dehalococcoidales bacterium]